MKIRKIELKNIGVFENETIEFKLCPAKDKAEIHIFTGQNGSGKTTLLMALASNYDYFRDTLEFPSNVTPYTLSNKLHKRFREKAALTILSDYIANDGIIKRKTTIYKDPHSKFVRGHHSPNDFYHHAASSEGWAYKNSQFSYAVFAFSGYRKINDERIEAIREPENFNPLYQSLQFIKDYSLQNQLTINQLIANNISKSAIEKERNKERSRKFANVIKSIEHALSEITGWEIKFDLETEPTNLITKINGENLDFDVLPDGLRSLISWIADLLGRIDLLKWNDDLPIFEKNLILLLDEIEIHLHPAWQRKVLPVVQKLFKNAQIFVSTHSPFVINSIDNAWVYLLKLDNCRARVTDIVKSEDGVSYQTVLSEILGVDEEFGGKTQDDLDKFYSIIRNGKRINLKELKKLAKSLAVQSEELNSLVQIELRQLSRRKGKEISI